WGWVKTREYAAMKLTLYLFIGSVVALVGALAMYWAQYQNTGVLSFNMLEMENAGFSASFQNLWFLPVFLGFAVLGGIWPFHNWSPDGHVAAPTAVSMFHAGVLMKLGAFAALRVGIMLLPEGAKYWSWLIMDGVMTALFFAVTGMIYDRSHTRMIPELGGMAKIMPFAAIGFIIGGLVSMGMPGFSGFVAEFPIFMGVWKEQWLVAVVSSISIIITAAYIMINIRKVFFAPLPEKLEGHVGDITVLDKVAIATLCLCMVAIGLFPSIMVPMVENGVRYVMNLLGGA
ncbi:MAG: NADH-quinone oxidoreductase subunit M, partial [Chloroflexi bacterium]|nr:NADH-quinone oxidoreductase subunit M [Chloroflexota bacterium]